MANVATKVPVKTEGKQTPAAMRPLEKLRQEVDRLFDRFPFGNVRSPFDLEPFWHGEGSWGAAPAVDVAETEKGYEVTAELPGMDEKDIEVKYADGALTLAGEKSEEKEETKKDYYLSERSFGAFQRTFSVPGVDVDKIAATFRKGVLTVSLPKSAKAVKTEKKIAISAK
jgi:HSP20 family protein